MTTSGRILVTGATGFVGRHLVAHLLSRQRPLTLAVRAAGACPPAWREDARIRIVETGPLESAGNLAEALADASTVVHLAGLAHAPHLDDDAFMAANARATERLAAAAAASGVRAFVVLSSLAAVTENEADAVVDDATDAPADTAYGRSKRLAEGHALALTANGAFVACLRPPLIVGADAPGNWAALRRLAATGLPLPFSSVRNRRSLVGVGLLVRALAHLCEHQWPAEKSGCYCLAETEPLSLPAIVSELRAGMGMPPRLFPFPPAIIRTAALLAGRGRLAAGLLGDLEVDSSRFRRTFGFDEASDLRAVIRESGSRRDRAAP